MGITREPTILAIDDDPMNIDLLENLFKNEGFRIISASNGPEGRHLARSQAPDLILLDVMMPDENGFATCSRLKLDPVTSTIPIIFISGVHEIESKVRGLRIGGVDYITKPFESADVLARARVHIKLSQAHNALVREQSTRLNEIHEAQKAFLVQPQEIPEAHFAISYKPVHEAGGDFYDVIRTSEGTFGYFVADISGHSLGASFITSALKALLRQNSGPLFSPLETVTMINGVMRSILKEGQYITASYAHINRFRSTLTVVGAGHPPVIYLPSVGPAETLDAEGDILGVFDTTSFEIRDKKVLMGDRFFLYSDGLIEGFKNVRKKRGAGLKQLTDAIVRTRALPLSEAVQEIMGILFPGEAIREDDVVLLGVEV